MSRKNHKWTQSDIDKLFQLKKDGKTNKECGEYFGCSAENIRNLIMRYARKSEGYMPPKPKKPKPKAEHFCKGCWAGTFADEGTCKCMFPKHCERKDGKL